MPALNTHGPMEADAREGITATSEEPASPAGEAEEAIRTRYASPATRPAADPRDPEDSKGSLADADGGDVEADSLSCAVQSSGHEGESSAADAPESEANDDAPKRESSKRRVTAKAGSVSSCKKQRRPRAETSPAPAERKNSMPPPPVPGMGVSEAPATSSTARPGEAPEQEGAAGCFAEPDPETEKLRSEMETLREQFMQQRRKLQVNSRSLAESKQALAEVLKRLAKREFCEELDKLQARTFRLGHCRQTHVGLGMNQNTWNGGYDEEEIRIRKDRIEEDRQNIAKERKTIAKADDMDDQLERREILTHRAAYLTKEENIVKEMEQQLQIDRAMHLKRQQRLEAARRSNFSDYSKMKDRYQLLNMIGRGGFSEVYRAFDLETNDYCAVKIHELGKDMSESQRQNYIRRAMREYEIQKGLKHPKVVILKDCFPISNRAFGTVLELCTGDTLDEYMKRYGVLPEREARGVIIQVLSGLRYLNSNETGNKIIHYDLKPGNLFFQGGEVKIADFGLSKIVHQSTPGDSIDLTSQGAGTYWYLPPECMVIEANQGEPPKISNKVDVWSTGVIFFELLFGRRPYGHGQSQEALRRSALAQGFDHVQLPATPKVSPECARYLKRLLSLNKENRPDVIEALADPYIRGVSKKPRVTRANSPEAEGGGVCTQHDADGGA